MLLVLAGGLGRGGHAGRHGLRDAEEQPQAVAEHFLGHQVGLAQDADHRRMPSVGLEEHPDPLAEHAAPSVIAGHDGEIARHDLHVVQRVFQQGLEEVLFVGEIQVESAVRDARPAYHVVDADAVEAALLELDHPGFEQLTDGLPALGAQLTVLRGGAAAERRSSELLPRWPPGPA